MPALWECQAFLLRLHRALLQLRPTKSDQDGHALRWTTHAVLSSAHGYPSHAAEQELIRQYTGQRVLGLRREIVLIDAVGISTGVVIGSGIFVVTGLSTKFADHFHY